MREVTGSRTGNSAPPDRLSAARPFLLVSAATLTVISVGLPWHVLSVGGGTDPWTVTIPGTHHAVRVLAPLAAWGVWWGLTRGPRGWAWGGVICATFALSLQPSGSVSAPGRLVFAVAILLTVLALASGASRRASDADGDPSPG